MHRAALEGVVEVLAVRGSAIDERCACRIERARVAEGGAAPRGFPSCERGAHVIGVAGRDAQTGDVDQQLFKSLPGFVRHGEARHRIGELLRDRFAHDQRARITNPMVSAPNTSIASAITAYTACSEATSAPPTMTSASRAVPASTGHSTCPAPCEAK